MDLGKTRWLTHLGLAIFSGIFCLMFYLYSGTLIEALSLGLGYAAILLTAATLLIGPLNLLRKRRNPVNINLRRDVGIWAGVTALAHVVVSFPIFEDGDILSFFLTKQPGGGYSLPQINLFTASNYIGLLATVVMVALLVTSNQLSLKWLKGKKWKSLQRFNYPLGVLAVLHTIGYQLFGLRESPFMITTLVLSAVVLGAQLVGVVVWRQRSQKRQAENATSAPAANTLRQTTEPALARRKFLVMGSTAIVTSFAVGFAADRVLFGAERAKAGGLSAATTTQATATSTTAPTASATAAPTTAAATTPAQRAGRSGRVPPTTTTPAAQAPATTTTPAAQAPATATTPAAASSAGSLVLTTAANLAPGTAFKFNAPDTGELSFVVKTKDGTIKAWSGICTHRPYDLYFDTASQTLYCDLHNVPFNVLTGAAMRSPARKALPNLKVEVDTQGNIVYKQ